jgi:hypothetical protein
MFSRYLALYEQGNATPETKFGGLTEFVFAVLLGMLDCATGTFSIKVVFNVVFGFEFCRIESGRPRRFVE